MGGRLVASTTPRCPGMTCLRNGRWKRGATLQTFSLRIPERMLGLTCALRSQDSAPARVKKEAEP